MTPDWATYDDRGIAKEIVDVVTLHPRYDIDQDIARTVGPGAIWTGWITTAPDRLYAKLQDKFGAYSTYAKNNRVAFVVALFSEFMAPLDATEIDHVLRELHGGLFRDYPHVSGLVHFEQSDGAYRFSCFTNARASIQSEMLGCFFEHARGAAHVAGPQLRSQPEVATMHERVFFLADYPAGIEKPVLVGVANLVYRFSNLGPGKFGVKSATNFVLLGPGDTLDFHTGAGNVSVVLTAGTHSLAVYQKVD